jgi:HEAT repeat protein
VNVLAPIRICLRPEARSIDPGTPPVLDAHLLALCDPDPAVRRAGARFKDVPADDTVVRALGTALGDPCDDLRLLAAGSLTEILFRNPAAIPALLKALSQDGSRQPVVEALANHLDIASDWADFDTRASRAGLEAVLAAAITALDETLSLKNEEIGPVVFGLLGRIVAFSSFDSDQGRQMAIEPALQLYLEGLENSDPAVRKEVLDRLAAIPIGRADILAALNKFLERADHSAADRESALRAMKRLSDPASAGVRARQRRDRRTGRVWIPRE